jgi:hypothetical protein
MPYVLASVAAAELMPRNTSRKSFIIQNEDTIDSIYIKRERSESTTVSSTNHDAKIGPGSFFGLNSLGDGRETIEGRYTFIARANTPAVSWFESEDIIR